MLSIALVSEHVNSQCLAALNHWQTITDGKAEILLVTSRSQAQQFRSELQQILADRIVTVAWSRRTPAATIAHKLGLVTNSAGLLLVSTDARVDDDSWSWLTQQDFAESGSWGWLAAKPDSNRRIALRCAQMVSRIVQGKPIAPALIFVSRSLLSVTSFDDTRLNHLHFLTIISAGLRLKMKPERGACQIRHHGRCVSMRDVVVDLFLT